MTVVKLTQTEVPEEDRYVFFKPMLMSIDNNLVMIRMHWLNFLTISTYCIFYERRHGWLCVMFGSPVNFLSNFCPSSSWYSKDLIRVSLSRYGNATVVENTEKGWRDLIFHKIRTGFGFGLWPDVILFLCPTFNGGRFQKFSCQWHSKICSFYMLDVNCNIIISQKHISSLQLKHWL